MTREPDIAAQLRDIYATHPMVMKAVTEIGRLKMALGPGATEAWEHMYDEIERLKAEIKKYEDEQCGACRAYRQQIEERAALEPKP